MFDEHYVSITRDFSESIETAVIEDHDTTSTCEAKEDGVCCQSLADHPFTTTEGITRHVCDHHFRKLLRMIYAWHLIRRESRGAA